MLDAARQQDSERLVVMNPHFIYPDIRKLRWHQGSGGLAVISAFDYHDKLLIMHWMQVSATRRPKHGQAL
eukprot:1141013-Pelagomonas_calceolata.AAC.9